MRWLLKHLARYLLGPAAVDGISDEMMDSLVRAMDEQAAALFAQDKP